MTEKLTEQEVLLALELSKIPEAKLTKPQRKLRNSLADRVKLENEDLKRQVDAQENSLRFARRFKQMKQYLWDDLSDAESYAVSTIGESNYPVLLIPRMMKSGRIVHQYIRIGEAGRFKGMPRPPELKLLEWIAMLHEAIQIGDAELAAIFGMAVARGLLESNQPDMAQRATRTLNRSYARAPRNKPRLGTRAVLIAFNKGHRDASSVSAFFDKWEGHREEDRWGGVNVERSDEIDGWELIDEDGKLRRDGERPTRKILRRSLPSMVSRARKLEKKYQ